MPDREIVVEGRTKKSVEQTVRKMTADRSATGQIGRWNDPICVNVANLDQPYAGFLIDRIYTVAESLKLKTGRDDCKANVLVVMTTDAGGVVRQLGKAGVSDKDVKQLMKPRPVRWFSLSETRNADGRLIKGFSPGELNINRTTNPASHISEQTREATITSIVIVDFNLITGTSWPQLADYIAFVVIGKPHFGDEYDGPTILALFKDRDEKTMMPQGLSRQDQGFLLGLYNSFDLIGGASQQSVILKAAEKGADLEAPPIK